jgi:AcrR family transcriptional regulator
MSSKREQRKRELIRQRRAQILEAAAKVFAEKGFQRATIKEIAAEAGVAEGTIYNYFRSKEELLINIPRQIGQPVLDAMAARVASREAFADVRDDEAFLTELITQGMKRAGENVAVIRVLFSSIPSMDEETLETYLRQMPLYAAGLLEDYVRARVEAGVFRPVDPVLAARAALGMFLVFLMMQEILPGARVAPVDYQAAIPELVRLFLYGVVARPEDREDADAGTEGK